MHVIVVGCGRVGSTVARGLSQAGHEVVVIDRRADSFRRLGADFGGRTLTGVGFDREVLRQAGITAASSVAAVTSGDNSNILIARVARETFGAERVVARIYDPARADVYERLGIATVATVAWTAAKVSRHVVPGRHGSDWNDPTSRFELVEQRVPASAAGLTVAAVEAAGVRVALLTRNGRADLPGAATLLQEDDVLHAVLAGGERHRLEDVLAGIPTSGGGH